MTQPAPLSFRHEVIDADPNGTHQDVCLIADIDGKPYQPERHIDVWFNEG